LENHDERTLYNYVNSELEPGPVSISLVMLLGSMFNNFPIHLPPPNPEPRNIYSAKCLYHALCVHILGIPSHSNYNCNYYICTTWFYCFWSGFWGSIPGGGGNFSLHNRVQNGSRANPASYPMGTRGSFPGVKAAGAWGCPLTSI